MNRMTQIFILTLTAFSATGASAAIFDSLESVDQLKIIAEQRTKTDRMPAGKVAEPTKDDETTDSAAAPETEKKN